MGFRRTRGKIQRGQHILSLGHVTCINIPLNKVKSRHREAPSTHLDALAKMWMHPYRRVTRHLSCWFHLSQPVFCSHGQNTLTLTPRLSGVSFQSGIWFKVQKIVFCIIGTWRVPLITPLSFSSEYRINWKSMQGIRNTSFISSTAGLENMALI